MDALQALAAAHRAAEGTKQAAMSDADRAQYRALADGLRELPFELLTGTTRDGLARSVTAFDMAVPVQASAGASPDQVALAAITSYRNLFGLDAVLKDLGPADTRQDSAGGWHVHLAQSIEGLPVFRAGIVVHLTPGLRLAGFTSFTVPRDRVDTLSPVVTEATASSVAVAAMPAGISITGSDATLGVFAPEAAGLPGGGGVLAWRVHVATDPRTEAMLVYVGATSGAVLHMSALAVGYDGRYKVHAWDPFLRPVWTSGDGLAALVDGTRLPVLYGMEWSFTYFNEALVRNSWNGCRENLYVIPPPRVDAWMEGAADASTAYVSGFHPGRWEPGITFACPSPIERVPDPYPDVSNGLAYLRSAGACNEIVLHEFAHGMQQQAGWLSSDLPTAIVAEGVADAVSQLGEAYHNRPADDREAASSNWVVEYNATSAIPPRCDGVLRNIGAAYPGDRCALDPGGPFGPHPVEMADYLHAPGLGFDTALGYYNSTLASRIGYLMGRPRSDTVTVPVDATVPAVTIPGITELLASPIWASTASAWLGAAPMDFTTFAPVLWSASASELRRTGASDDDWFAAHKAIWTVTGWRGPVFNEGSPLLCGAPSDAAMFTTELGGNRQLYMVYNGSLDSPGSRVCITGWPLAMLRATGAVRRLRP